MLGSQEHSAVPSNHLARQIRRQVQRVETLAHWEKPGSSPLPVALPSSLLGALFYLSSFCDGLLSVQRNLGLEEFFKITVLSNRAERHQDAEEVFRTLQEILKD